MQVENDYERDVYNGDLGIVRKVDGDESELVVNFEGRDVAYSFGELDELVLAYATTIHKSQGSARAGRAGCDEPSSAAGTPGPTH